MEFDQKDALVICVSPGMNRRWDVSEKGREEPFASFDDKEDAYAYAAALTSSRENATALVEEEEGFSLLPSLAGPGRGSAGTGRKSGRKPDRGSNDR